MELQFRERALTCLRQSAADTKRTEEVLELRLPENMPPIGRVLGAWGQCLVRGKEWQSDKVSVSGGVLARVLYESEDGLQLRCVEGWLPFQLKWELKDSQRDGTVVVSCAVPDVDARQVGAERLMLRATVVAMAQALEEESYALWEPEAVEGLELLQQTHTLCLATEAGEKQMSLQEEVMLPPGQMDVAELMFYELTPRVREAKVAEDKLVLRLSAMLHAVYLGPDGMLHAYNTELPFSQFAQLGRIYGQEAEVWAEPAVTDLELESLGDGRLRVKAGLLGQYVVYDRCTVTVTADAYAPGKQVQLQKEQLHLPAIRARSSRCFSLSHSFPQGATEVVCAALKAPQARQLDGKAELQAVMGVLYYDSENRPQHMSAAVSRQWELPEGFEAAGLWFGQQPGVQAEAAAEGLQLHCGPEMLLVLPQNEGLDLVKGVTVADAEPQERPSLILRRSGGLDLWELAKHCGSTRGAIMEANGLEGEPEEGQMLLIPVV